MYNACVFYVIVFSEYILCLFQIHAFMLKQLYFIVLIAYFVHIFNEYLLIYLFQKPKNSLLL